MQLTIMLLLVAYLIGSIPFSYIVTKLITGQDIRKFGSGNVGATNVLRTTGRMAGFVALLLDVCKGIGVVLLARYLFPQSKGIEALAGFVTMLGHSYSVFLRFRGGKSVATGGGAFFMITPVAILSAIAVFVVSLISFRIVAVASVLAAASFPFFAWIFNEPIEVIFLGAVAAALIVFRHKTNIINLIHGKEKKIGEPEDA